MYIDKNKNIITTVSAQDRFLRAVYSNALLRAAIKPLTLPAISKLAGRFLDSELSEPLIAPFVRLNNIDLGEYEPVEFRSFNEFFTRKTRRGARPIDNTAVISPSDGKASAFRLDEGSSFKIKGISYTVEALVKSRRAARLYLGGTAVVVRLSVEDYHRYCYAVSGKKSAQKKIPGVFHTVNPAALGMTNVFCENSREFCVIASPVGPVVQMEIGAMLVGRISNHTLPAAVVTRGEEKGYFEFGGSSIALLLPRSIAVRPDILENTALGLETEVSYGENLSIV